MARTNVVADLDATEAVLWTILDRFETLAATQYAVSAPALLSPAKAAVVALLQTQPRVRDALAGTRLAEPVSALVASATSGREAHVLIAQGLLLELIGEAIYRTFADNAEASPRTRELCRVGLQASGHARSSIPDLLRSRVGVGDVLLAAIMVEADALLRSLDALGEGIDEVFAERFQVGFADLMGDVAAELISLCIDLDVDRRKLVSFLTGALMGV